ncbi:MAG: hypothetical protein CVT49_10390 [candidate division Zixibacteria bacterium HGW-Zixibacteria-1]|nr:MAG: hypothetical protein CVT49_10390 [candidate division Zixibacteria bacterium HGW-Zixibacteria-1]
MSLKPYNSELMKEMGQLLIEDKKYDMAIKILKRAQRISPEHIYITESLALAYIYKQQFDSAFSLADVLFEMDKNSPGGHLVKMVIALWNNDQKTARKHYMEYLKYGQERSDYERIREYYHHLNE